MEEDTDIKIKTRFLGDVIVQHARPPLVLDNFFSLLKDACKQSQAQQITVKWIDEDGDPVTIESQMELDEAVRILHQNEEAEMDIHVFLGTPAQPGLPCQGEDRNIYRRGARRWNKVYLYNGHRFQAKRLNRRVHCVICSDYIWGLGRAGYRCTSCRTCVHKKCVRQVRNFCGENHEGPKMNVAPATVVMPPSALKGANGDRRQYTGHTNGAFQEAEIQIRSETVQVENASKWSVSLDDFRFLTVIGRGSYAKVVQAEHKKTKQIYAIKIIKKQMFSEDEDIDWVQTEKAVFEAASNHPFLVGLHSCFQTASRLFFVIEFVPGGDLMFHMQRQRRLPEDHARFYSAEIILALHFLHSRGIIYRDLKLDNVLIDSEGHIKLTDYGMCKENIGPTDTTTTFCGTPNYIAPEILRGEAYGFSVDWWALGVLMYEMMAGRSPFDIPNGDYNSDQNTEDYLFQENLIHQTILEKMIKIPRSISVRATHILKQFLNKDPTARLGCKPDLDESLAEMKDHQFFSGLIDFDALELKQIPPPYNPSVNSDRDLQHFDQQFTEEPPTLTPDDSRIIEKIDQSEFEGFEYVNPLQMSREDSV